MNQPLTDFQKNYISRLLKGEFRLDNSLKGYLNGTDIPFQDALYAVVDSVFKPNSQQLIYTSGITNKIESYGEVIDTLIFTQNRFNELSKSGIWVNHSIVCPADYNQIVFLWLNDSDGSNDLVTGLEKASTLTKFRRFTAEFRKNQNEKFIYEIIDIDKQSFACLTLQEACEFVLKLNNIENWTIEMNERACRNTFTDWQNTLKNSEFNLLAQSKTYRNETFVESLKGRVSLFDENFEPIEFPEIHAMVLAEKG
jgi:hypothetical protein